MQRNRFGFPSTDPKSMSIGLISRSFSVCQKCAEVLTTATYDAPSPPESERPRRSVWSMENGKGDDLRFGRWGSVVFLAEGPPSFHDATLRELELRQGRPVEEPRPVPSSSALTFNAM